MQTEKRFSLVTKLSLVASLSALYVAFRIIPTFPMIGIPGTFRAGDFASPLYGIILGPLLGPLAVSIGTIVGFFVGAPPQFLGLDFLPGACSAAIVGLVIHKQQVQSVMLNLAILLVFVLLPFSVLFIPVGQILIPYNWLHLVGLALLASPLSRKSSMEVARNWRGGSETKLDSGGMSSYRFWRHFRAFFVVAFSGTLAQHLTGGILTQLVVGLYLNTLPRHFSSWQDFWTVVFYAYPIERAVIALTASLIGSASIMALKISRLSERLPAI